MNQKKATSKKKVEKSLFLMDNEPFEKNLYLAKESLISTRLNQGKKHAFDG